MRSKEFIECIILFTILYFLFFFLYDFVQNRKQKKLEMKKVSLAMDEEAFFRFACFYGLQKKISKEILNSIYQDIYKNKSFRIVNICNKYSLSNYEVIVIVLYFEFCHILEHKKVSLEDENVDAISFNEQALLYKYGSYFSEKKTYNEIVKLVGDKASSELDYINQFYLFPGVRILNSTIYYVGDIHESA